MSSTKYIAAGMASERTELRRQLRERRRALSDREQRHASTAIWDILETRIRSLDPATAGAYVATDGEPGVSAAVDHLRAMGWQIAYPRIDTHHSNRATMGLYIVEDDAHLVPGGFGLVEPDPSTPTVAPSDLALVLVPLVGFDTDLNRLGRGKGYYDRAFKFLLDGPRPSSPLLVGIAHECQRVGSLTPSPRDVALDAVVTPQQMYGSL